MAAMVGNPGRDGRAQGMKLFQRARFAGFFFVVLRLRSGSFDWSV